jgi:radical SAM superfamily enzyme YgiQ (UPF0313 family)
MEQTLKIGKQKKILLVDVDSTIPNLPLMKLSTFHKGKGYVVELIRLQYDGKPGKRQRTLIRNKGYEQVYISIIFTPNRDVIKIEDPEIKNYQFGGTGTEDITKQLPKDIDDLEQDYSLYPDNDEILGFYSRGCPNKCFFCKVPIKEGNLYKYNDWEKIVENGKKYGLQKVRFLDNNFLAYPDCEKVMQELIDNNIRCSFNEGLDFRQITEGKAKLLSELRYYPTEYIFAFDNAGYLPLIEKQYKIIKKYIKQDWKIKFYCYVHPDMALKDTVLRLEWCRNNKALVYIMKDKACYSSPNKDFYRDICSWCNAPGIYKNHGFMEHMNRHSKDNTRILKSCKLYQDCIKQIKEEGKL